MYKLFVGLAALLLLFVGCEQEEEPVRQLFFLEYTVLGQSVETPAWFYPETGEMAYLCPDCPHACMHSGSVCDEEVHGEECLFYKFNSRRGYSLTEDKLYYFLAEDLYVYDTVTGTRERLKDKNTPGWVDESYIFKGEYLYHYDLDSEQERGYSRMERIHLPDMTVTDIRGQQIPARIIGETAYYVIADSSPYIVSGLYRQPLYAYGEDAPVKELLLYEVDMGIPFLIEEDAVYWVGSDALWEDPDTITNNLYRYDFSKQSMILLAKDFYCGRIVSDGECLYAVRNDGTCNVLIQIHSDGNQKILYVPEEGYMLKMTSLEIVGKYLIADLQHDTGETKEKIWFDLETGESRRRTFPYGNG